MSYVPSTFCSLRCVIEIARVLTAQHVHVFLNGLTMGKAKKGKKKPVTHVQLTRGWGKKGHQKLIAGYHAKKKRLEMLRSHPPANVLEEEVAAEISALEDELEKNGGLDVYQVCH